VLQDGKSGQEEEMKARSEIAEASADFVVQGWNNEVHYFIQIPSHTIQ